MEAEALPQIREARLGKEKTADFIRTAIASELAKRKRQKQSAEWRKEIP